MNRTNNLSVLAAVFTLLILTLSPSFKANADMGRITVSHEAVKVSEDAQKAIILHNLEEEVLILGTDLKADKKTGIIRFIPFPSEPIVGLAPEGAFEKASAMIKKYELKYIYVSQSKGGSAATTTEGVEVRFNKKLGAHDLTIIKVNDVSTFRQWVNSFFKSKGLPVKEKYPEEEAIVDDYVKRGIVYFVLDYVEVFQEIRFIEPVSYKFKSKELYYPLKTSNTFGGEGSIELIIMAPTTLFAPTKLFGSTQFVPTPLHTFDPYLPFDRALYAKGSLFLNIPLQASTSALIVKEEEDIKEIYPGGESFFKGQEAFIQVIRYKGKYDFTDDIFVDVSKGLPSAVGAYEVEEEPYPWESMSPSAVDINKTKCSLKPDRGPCKGNFTRYYYDPLSNECKEFVWGGCGGVVPFETKEECEKCKKDANRLQENKLDLGVSTPLALAYLIENKQFYLDQPLLIPGVRPENDKPKKAMTILGQKTTDQDWVLEDGATAVWVSGISPPGYDDPFILVARFEESDGVLRVQASLSMKAGQQKKTHLRKGEYIFFHLHGNKSMTCPVELVGDSAEIVHYDHFESVILQAVKPGLTRLKVFSKGWNSPEVIFLAEYELVVE